jgi:hypothetical protein
VRVEVENQERLKLISMRLLGQGAGLFLATLAGRTLGVVFYLGGMLRTRHRKALHPQGGVRSGVVERHGCRARTGVPWIDEPGNDQVMVRLSRATGLPEALPDVLGLALRVPREDGGHGDLLLSTTGTSALGRFVIRPTRHPARPYGSLMPYRSPLGPLLVAAFPLAADGTRFALACSGLRGTWLPFGVLEVRSNWDDAPDAPLTFDPVIHQLPGLQSYGWVAQLRRFSYAGSRRARGAVLESSGSGPTSVPAASGDGGRFAHRARPRRR